MANTKQNIENIPNDLEGMYFSSSLISVSLFNFALIANNTHKIILNIPLF